MKWNLKNRVLRTAWFYILADLFIFLVFVLTIGRKREETRKLAPCVFNISEHPGSSTRDVVFLYATSSSPGLLLSIKSLRTTQSRCRIILLWGSSKISKQEAQFFSHFNVEVIPNCYNFNRGYVPHMIRYEYEAKWLEEHVDEVDRVFHTDAFDVFFQGDPFARHVRFDRLTFVVEPHCFRSCGWNLAWMQRCYPEAGSKFNHNFILCSGSISGSSTEYLKLVKLMMAQNEWTKCWEASLDQPILNYLVWTGEVTKAGINYSLTGCDGGFLTVQWCVTEENVKFNEHNQITSDDGSVPSYIHQYNRIPAFQKQLFQICNI